MVNRNFAIGRFPEQPENTVLDQVDVGPRGVMFFQAGFRINPALMEQAGQVSQKPGVRITFMSFHANTEYPAETVQQGCRRVSGVLMDDVWIILSQHAGSGGEVWPGDAVHGVDPVRSDRVNYGIQEVSFEMT